MGDEDEAVVAALEHGHEVRLEVGGGRLTGRLGELRQILATAERTLPEGGDRGLLAQAAGGEVGHPLAAFHRRQDGRHPDHRSPGGGIEGTVRPCDHQNLIDPMALQAGGDGDALAVAVEEGGDRTRLRSGARAQAHLLGGAQLPIGLGRDQGVRGVAQPDVGEHGYQGVRGTDLEQGDGAGADTLREQGENPALHAVVALPGQREQGDLGRDRIARRGREPAGPGGAAAGMATRRSAHRFRR